jgi:hypothetical protein
LVEASAANCLPTGLLGTGTPPRQKARKVFERNSLALDLLRTSVALGLIWTLFLRYVCQVKVDREKMPRDEKVRGIAREDVEVLIIPAETE